MQVIEMINRLSKTVCFVLMAALFVTGCEQRYQQDQLIYGPLSDPNFVVPDYASPALQATGGRRAWIEADKLELDCIVTFYQPDGTYYLTEQHYEIQPLSNLIRISAAEPQGSFVCELAQSRFAMLAGGGKVNALPINVCRRYLAEAILYIVTAPVRLADDPVGFTKTSMAVKVEGQWYYQIKRRTRDDIEPAQRLGAAVFYQSRDTSLVDLLQFASVDGGTVFVVRGYDYGVVKKGGVLVPAKIEIFTADAGGSRLRRVVKIDLK